MGNIIVIFSWRDVVGILFVGTPSLFLGSVVWGVVYKYLSVGISFFV